ncbi:hypothetical protein Hdeb2414_s0017g00513011 [Helianthus debilis subsp. tardiflorus]
MGNGCRWRMITVGDEGEGSWLSPEIREVAGLVMKVCRRQAPEKTKMMRLGVRSRTVLGGRRWTKESVGGCRRCKDEAE